MQSWVHKYIGKNFSCKYKLFIAIEINLSKKINVTKSFDDSHFFIILKVIRNRDCETARISEYYNQWKKVYLKLCLR